MIRLKNDSLGVCHGGSHGFYHAILVFFATILSTFSAPAANPPDAFNDGIDRTDPNFVTASLLVMSPMDWDTLRSLHGLATTKDSLAVRLSQGGSPWLCQ